MVVESQLQTCSAVVYESAQILLTFTDRLICLYILHTDASTIGRKIPSPTVHLPTVSFLMIWVPQLGRVHLTLGGGLSCTRIHPYIHHPLCELLI